jgi:hypothetical protein
MATDKSFEDNQHLGKVLAQGRDLASILRGFVGTSDRDGYIRLFASLADTSLSVDVAEADILEIADVLNNQLGKRIVWVKKGAQITVTKTRTTPFGVRPNVGNDPNLAAVRSGRLTMQVRANEARDTCVSICSCGTCQSQCTNPCEICVCIPQQAQPQ